MSVVGWSGNRDGLHGFKGGDGLVKQLQALRGMKAITTEQYAYIMEAVKDQQCKLRIDPDRNNENFIITLRLEVSLMGKGERYDDGDHLD